MQQNILGAIIFLWKANDQTSLENAGGERIKTFCDLKFQF